MDRGRRRASSLERVASSARSGLQARSARQAGEDSVTHQRTLHVLQLQPLLLLLHPGDFCVIRLHLATSLVALASDRFNLQVHCMQAVPCLDKLR